MKITKFVHSCLLVEDSERSALFDPGVMSEDALNAMQLSRLDDIIITHEHNDHKSIPLIKRLVAQFPEVRITSTPEVVEQLTTEGISASSAASDGIAFFHSPHEGNLPFMSPPNQIGVHYLGVLSHPGDSHSFIETKAILALPVTAPWGSTLAAVNLALKLQPQYIVPIHDWHWRDEAREMLYDRFEQLFKNAGITFFKLETGKPIEVEVST